MHLYLVKQRLYFDTSVFGSYFDDEFEDFTKPLFDKIIKGDFMLLFSTVTQDELENAPLEVKKLVKRLKVEYTEFIEETEEAVEFASQYISGKVVGQTSYADCLHIALATIHRADFLISWNFKHILNVQRIMGYNSVNIRNSISN